ncbi:HNH endonuclease [Gordonia phage Zany]|uniref:HNH endonuclease n=1 Tax=Gordonia phage Zany TaxID=2910759 RepID=A0AA49BMM8_9CAUD|nr:HNH endonuclease [Gordonia phage Zany]
MGGGFKNFKKGCEEQDLPCWICHEPIDYKRKGSPLWWFTRDHYIPRTHGGSNAVANLRPAHSLCNQRRGSRMPRNTNWVGTKENGHWSSEPRAMPIDEEINNRAGDPPLSWAERWAVSGPLKDIKPKKKTPMKKDWPYPNAHPDYP